jgi:hypothetical protein
MSAPLPSAAFAAVALALFAASAGPAAAADEPRTQAAVLAADDDWLAAERLGDAAALDARLADAYHDVSPTGSVHLKAHLLEHTRTRKDKMTGTPQEVAAIVRKKYPVRETVEITGDTAVLTFHSVDPAQNDRILSVDVFTYENGRWRGMLSVGTTQPVVAATPAG